MAANFVSGSSQYLQLDSGLVTPLGATASVALWFRTTQAGSGSFWEWPGPGVGVESAGDGNDYFYGIIDTSGHLVMKNGDDVQSVSLAPVNDGNWHHAVMVRDIPSLDVRLSVDGVLQEQNVPTDTATKTTDTSSIGRFEDTGGTPAYYNGDLDDLRIYSRAISPDEALSLFTYNGADTIRQDMVFRWRFNESHAGQVMGGVKNETQTPNDGAGVNSPIYTAGFTKWRRRVA